MRLQRQGAPEPRWLANLSVVLLMLGVVPARLKDTLARPDRRHAFSLPVRKERYVGFVVVELIKSLPAPQKVPRHITVDALANAKLVLDVHDHFVNDSEGTE